MGKTLVLKAPDGRVAIMSVADGEGYEEKALASFSAAKFVPVSITEIDPAAIPTDRTFRDAWNFDSEAKVFDHDMDRAKKVHKDKLRNDRAPLLAALDLEISKALSQGRNSDVIRHEAERQRLRDVTEHPDITKAKTIDDLRKITVE